MIFKSFNVGVIYRIKTLEHSKLSFCLIDPGELKRDLSEI